MMFDKKALAGHKVKHSLHVLLIMEQEGVTKGAAEAQAYGEGLDGLTGRQHRPAVVSAPTGDKPK